MSDKFQSILLGGAVIGVVNSFLPVLSPFLGCLGCLLLPVAGLVSVWHYTNNSGEFLKPGQGAGVGALAGIVATVVGGLIGLLLTQLGLAPDPQEMSRQMSEMFGQELDPEALEAQQTPAMMAIGYVVGALAGIVLGAIGGAIGASIFGKKE